MKKLLSKMGKIFEEFFETEEGEKKPLLSKRNYIFLCILIFSAWVFYLLGTIYSRPTIMSDEKTVVSTINMKKGNILVQQVQYSTYKKIDPNDTGDIYFEVVKSNDEGLEPGDLVKFNPRFIEKVEIENKVYVILNSSQIQFHITKEDVKNNLLKR